jgi:hypothetical protein
MKLLRAIAVGALGLPVALCGAEPNPATRIIPVHKGDIPTIYTQFGYNTVVILDGEQVTGQLSPDKTFWSFDTGDNFLLVKAKGNEKQGHPGQKTNVNVTTASNNVYTFLVVETSNSTQPFDLRVEIQQEDAESLAAQKHPQWVRVEEQVRTKNELADVREELEQTKKTAADKEIRNIRHDYKWKSEKEAKAAAELGISAIYHDDVFTYVEVKTQAAPALYELRDGHDSLINSELHQGLYTVQKILDKGYFRLGKTKVEFERAKES